MKSVSEKYTLFLMDARMLLLFETFEGLLEETVLY